MKRRSRKAPSKSPARRPKALSDDGVRVVFTERQIRARVGELAGRINRDYRGKVIHAVGILENCFMFMADLLRSLNLPVVCHFLKVESREQARGTGALRELTYWPNVDAKGKDVLLVDGVLQSGLTQDHLYRYLLGQEPASLRTVTLVEKPEERKMDVATDYLGFKSSEKFLVGYGLGFEEKHRNLPYIAALR